MKLYQIWLLFFVGSFIIHILHINIPDHEYLFGLIAGVFVWEYNNSTNMLSKTKDWLLGLFKK